MNLTHFKRRVKTFTTHMVNIAVLTAASSTIALAAPGLPNIKILATGGTIAGAGVSSTQYAGYQAAVTPVDKLLLAVPELGKIANVTGEQISQVASHNMSNEILLKLAKRINVLLASPEVDGVVITHGTNTLEESAYFLNLVVKSEKPVVMVGAMRPGTSMSADGPMNIFRSVITAGSKDSRGRGVMVVMNDQIIGARDLQKTDTMTVDTFKAPVFGYLGFVVDSKTHFYKPPARKHTHQTEFDISKVNVLPKVDIVMGYEDDSRAAVDAFVTAGAKGVVHAGSGTAAVSGQMQPGLEDAVKKGVAVVRAPRSSLGIITRNMEFDDDKFGTISGDTLSPPKARVLLMLGLTRTSDPKEIQRMFNEY
jgi:L-asparaginase